MSTTISRATRRVRAGISYINLEEFIAERRANRKRWRLSIGVPTVTRAGKSTPYARRKGVVSKKK